MSILIEILFCKEITLKNMLQVREANQHVNGNPMDLIYKGNSPVIDPNALKAELVKSYPLYF